MNSLSNKKILVVICGGISAYKSLELIRGLKKKKVKIPKYTIHKKMNQEIMNILKEHLDNMTNPYDDKKMSKRIFDCLNKSYKESQTIHHEYILTDLKKIKHKIHKNSYNS